MSEAIWIEPSGLSPPLAYAEALGAARAEGGGAAGDATPALTGLNAFELPRADALARLVGRLALSRRGLTWIGRGAEGWARLGEIGRGGESAAFRRLGHAAANGGSDPAIVAGAAAYRRAGGRIALAEPARRFWIARDAEGREVYLEERGRVDPSAYQARRISRLPFQRPVGLDPRLARAAANLAEIRPQERVLDPLVGTGALLAEAGLLGARLFGIDRDPEMVRGSVRNLAHLGLSAESLVVGPAASAEFPDDPGPFDAILTDAPYGRSSATGGERSDELVRRVLEAWAPRVARDGRIALIVPGGADPLPDGWRREANVPVRVHRSLTREFRLYRRG